MNLTGANLLLIWSNKRYCPPHLGVYFSHSTVPVLNLPLQDYISNTIIMNYNHVLRTHLHFLYSPPPKIPAIAPVTYCVRYIYPTFVLYFMFVLYSGIKPLSKLSPTTPPDMADIPSTSDR